MRGTAPFSGPKYKLNFVYVLISTVTPRPEARSRQKRISIQKTGRKRTALPARKGQASEVEHHAHHGGGQDEHDGVQALGGLDPPGQHQDHRRQGQGLPVDDGQARCPGVQQGDGHHRQARRRHHSRGRRAQTVKRRLHIAVVAEGLQKGRDDQNHDDGRRHQAQGGNNGPGDAAGDEAHIGGHVHADGARGGLADRQHIRQLGPGEPAGAVRHIVQKRQSGQAAAYGEQAGFEKFVKQLQIDHDRFAPRFLISSPATAAANT